MLSPLAVVAQEKATVVLPTDIYHEYPANGVPVMNGKVTGVKMQCGPAHPIQPVRIRLRCGGGSNAPQPIYVINGCMQSDYKIENVNPNDIESISILKNVSAIEKYGEQGKNGVIIITLKNKTTNTITKAEVSKPVPAL